MNAFPVDPLDLLDPLENSRRLDSVRRCGTSAAFARNLGPILIKNRGILWAAALGELWAISGTALRLEGPNLYQQSPDPPHLAAVMF